MDYQLDSRTPSKLFKWYNGMVSLSILNGNWLKLAWSRAGFNTGTINQEGNIAKGHFT